MVAIPGFEYLGTIAFTPRMGDERVDMESNYLRRKKQ
jgi:hypothetical protein